MSEFSKVIKTREIPEIEHHLGKIDDFMFSDERDTRTQIKMRFLDVEPKSDRFTDYITLEQEAKHSLVGWLLLFLFLFFIVVVI
jgi:hypothetical protein